MRDKDTKRHNQGTEGQPELVETAIQINRTSKKTKGGDRMGFTCLSVVGDRQGRVGIALSKAPSVVSAVQKSHKKARKHMFVVPIVGDARTIPHRIEVKLGATRLLLKPAPAGTGVRASTPIRSVLEAAGIQNIVTKSLGSNNIKGSVDTVLMALGKLKPQGDRIIKIQKKGDSK